METALELSPEFQQADILLVLNYLKKQDYKAAIEAAQAYRRRNLSSTTPLNLLGRVYLAADNRDMARASFRKALKLNTGDPAANHNLAQMTIASTTQRYWSIGKITCRRSSSWPCWMQKKRTKRPWSNI